MEIESERDRKAMLKVFDILTPWSWPPYAITITVYTTLISAFIIYSNVNNFFVVSLSVLLLIINYANYFIVGRKRDRALAEEQYNQSNNKLKESIKDVVDKSGNSYHYPNRLEYLTVFAEFSLIFLAKLL